MAERPKYIQGRPIDAYGAEWRDSDGNPVLLFKMRCNNCNYFWTLTIGLHRRNLEIIYVIP